MKTSAFDPLPHHQRCPCAQCDDRDEHVSPAFRGMIFGLPFALMAWLGIAVCVRFVFWA